MKKILFNDKFGLTQAVLEGRKTMTRRICKDQSWSKSDILAFNYDRLTLMTPPNYLIGEVVAIAQAYKDIYNDAYHIGLYGRTAGWTNKMYVAAYRMPHHIKITNIRVERLQDITDDDCLKEGIQVLKGGFRNQDAYTFKGDKVWWKTPREAFAALIDKVSGRGTWDNNPMMLVYEFDIDSSRLE